MLTKQAKIFMLLMMTAVLVSGFYAHDLWFSDEIREASILVRMANEGHYAVPMLGQELFVEKPPLYYWAGVLLLKINSSIFSLTNIIRLNSLLWGLGTLLVTYLLALNWAKYLPGSSMPNRAQHFAWLSVIILLSSNGFFSNILTIRTDIALTFFVSLTALGFCRAYLDKSNFGSVLAGIGLAGGFLSKGTVAIALSGLLWLPLMPFLITLCKEKRYAVILPHFILPALILILPTCLWIYFLIEQGGKAAWDIWFFENNIGRFFGGETVGHRASYFYYVKYLLLYTFPWGLFWIISLIAKGRKFWSENKYQRIVQLWVILPFLFLTLSTSKRPLYLLPLLPFVALAMASLWMRDIFSKSLKYLAIVICIMASSILLTSALSFEFFKEYADFFMAALFPISIWVAAILIICMVAGLIYFKREPLLQCAQAIFFLFIIINLVVFPAQNENLNGFRQLQPLFAQQSAEEWQKTLVLPLSEGLTGYLYIYHNIIPTPDAFTVFHQVMAGNNPHYTRLLVEHQEMKELLKIKDAQVIDYIIGNGGKLNSLYLVKLKT